MRLVSKVLFVFISLSLLFSCGFHLRGTVGLSAGITPIFIDQSGADNALNRELRSLLTGSEKALAESMSEANTVLEIVTTKTKRRVVAVDSSGRAQQYELNYIVRYSVTGKNIPLVGSDNISVLHLRRELTFDPDNVLGVGHEADNLYNDMRKESARLIMQRLQALGMQIETIKNTDERTSD